MSVSEVGHREFGFRVVAELGVTPLVCHRSRALYVFRFGGPAAAVRCESLRLLGRLPCCWRRDFAVDWVLQLSAFVDFYEPNKYIGKPMTESVLRELRGYFGVLPNST